MNIEDRIRMTMHDKVRIVISRRKRSQTGFTISGTDGTKATFPTKHVALQFLLAIVRCQPVRTFELKPTGRKSL